MCVVCKMGVRAKGKATTPSTPLTLLCVRTTQWRWKKFVPCVAPITKESLVVVVSEGRGAGDVAKMDRQNHTHGMKDLSHAHQTIQPPQLVSMFHYNEGVADKYIPVNARRMLV